LVVPERAIAPELIAEIACNARDQSDFERAVLEVLDSQLGFDVAFFTRSNYVSEVAPGLDRSVLLHAREHWDTMSNELTELMQFAQRRGGVLIDDEVLGSELQRRRYYEVFMRPHRGHSTLFGFLVPRGVPLGELVLGRTGASSRFQAADEALLRQLIPTLSVAAASFSVQPAPNGAPAGRPSSIREAAKLTKRQYEVLQYLALGYTNAQIACALGTRERTVRNQLSAAYEKLGVSSRAEAVAVLLSPGT
jgi:DNA-binding CsgD family transcriptional regulator